MHHGRFQRTTLERVALAQELMIVLDALEPGDKRVRVVQPIIPQGASVFAQIDPLKEDILSDQSYNWAPISSGQTIAFRLAPEQVLAMACDGNTVVLGINIQWFEGEGA